jgi:hypothetical protein
MLSKNAPLKAATFILLVFLAASCSIGVENSAKVKAKADAAYAAQDCVQAVLLYKKLAAMDTIYLKLAQERISACTDRLARYAARELEKEGNSKIPQPPEVQPSSPSPSVQSQPSTRVEQSVKVCDPEYKNRIDRIQTELSPIQAKIDEIKAKISEVESKVKVTPSPDGGFDFSLPGDTTPEMAKVFEEGIARSYANNKAEEGALNEKAIDLKEKIATVESQANAAGVPRECLYPPAKGY